MYCQNCGTEIQDGSQFCPNCGQRADSAQAVGMQQSNNYGINQRVGVRQEEIAELNKMISYFSQMSAQYEEYDRVREMINPKYLRKRVGLLVWGIIICVIGLIFAFIPVWALAALLLPGGALMIFFYIYTSYSRNKNYAINCARYDELTAQLYQHYLNYGNCMVSAEYTNPSNLQAILNTIQSGRADTIKEALNILIEDAHRMNMETLATQTAVATAAAARGAKTAAVFSAANFFLK